MDRLLDLFASILDHSGIDLMQRVRECAQAAAAVGVPQGYLEEFSRFVESCDSRQLEEIYKAGSPTIGQQLYGEGYGRSMLLLDLQKRYRRQGFEFGEEPADSLSVVLRFLSECNDAEEKTEVAREILVPALEAMIAVGEPGAGVFLPLLRALSVALKEQVGS